MKFDELLDKLDEMVGREAEVNGDELSGAIDVDFDEDDFITEQDEPDVGYCGRTMLNDRQQKVFDELEKFCKENHLEYRANSCTGPRADSRDIYFTIYYEEEDEEENV